MLKLGLQKKLVFCNNEIKLTDLRAKIGNSPDGIIIHYTDVDWLLFGYSIQ